MIRCDLHCAFRPVASKVLEAVSNEFPTLLAGHKIYRPRFGIFVQPDICGQKNLSGETVIPTFTCNFNVDNEEEAKQLTCQVKDKLCTHPFLAENFLRIRYEIQISNVVWKDGQLEFLFKMPEIIPTKVSGLNYYDSHIHIENLRLEDWPKIAEAAAKFDMPIIMNVAKKELRPFITKRWYNSVLEDVFKDLAEIYKTLGVNFVLKTTPEVELTVWDPDCQVTDAGWMSTPNSYINLTEEYWQLPTLIKKNF